MCAFKICRMTLSNTLDPGCKLPTLPFLKDPLRHVFKESSEVVEAMKKAVVNPGFEKTAVLEPEKSKMAKRLARKVRELKFDRGMGKVVGMLLQLEREKTMGAKWFQLPATEMNEERKRDLKVLQLRDAIDPTIHYRRNYRKQLPKYFEIGRVVDNPIDFYSSRIPKKQRKNTIVEELLADAEVRRRMKQKYSEIAAHRNNRRKRKFAKHPKRRHGR
ncbi:hypothetical protein M513_10297 [Trichuris suis]|uniref:Fcf2 pre-rRNA processing C-terminal domain-containing protein n=1 Tax=Trichuris suis TaxID=68888 RepID=A0A085LV17_9BILA|nr:hypothetical protein M513_10297 [Trichuris suis]